MPVATVRGIHINYQVLGDRGSWVALSPGARREMQGVEPLAQAIAAAGHRVLIHDRRNCGASDVRIEGEDSEYEIWADDLFELLSQLGATPAAIGGSSSGCRLSLLFALRHRAAVRALLLWRVTGGQFSATRLAANYNGQYIELATTGGMQAVCDSEFFGERIAANPSVRGYLMGLEVSRFVQVMEHWRGYFLRGADLPVIGVTEEQLRSLDVPACVVPGNDWTHPRRIGEHASTVLPRAELHVVAPDDEETELSDWDGLQAGLADIFVDFLGRL